MTAWTTPKTWTIEETATAANLNTYLRDNQLHIFETINRQAFDFPYVTDYRYLLGSINVSAANACWYCRVFGTGTITKLRIFVTVSNGNIGVAVYDTTGTGVSASPNNRLATSGSVACPAAGAADVSIAATVTIGVLTNWFALSASGTTATFGYVGVVPASWENGLLTGQVAGHPPPATGPASTGTTGICFHMAGVP